MSDSVVVRSFIVFKHEQVFDFKVPDRIIQCSGSVSHAALRAASSSRLKHLVEGDNSCVIGVPTSDRRSKCSDTSSSDADASFLADILNNRASSSINTVQRIIRLNK